VLNILHRGDIPPSLNHTHIILISNKHHPNDISDFQPIRLCNILYKLVTKVIANRLKTCLPSIVSENQSAFVPGRMITDTILIAFKIFHDMPSCPKSNGGIALNLDKAKAFDRVEWPFLRAIMIKMGFHADWVNLVMSCVESATFCFIINGEPKGFVRPS